ncbi:hypothetical protein GCM10022240_27570 [Microbacterium kribbense]|uniref:Uncharacterized protein n=1 Tax=Microbacterium kribbense TaxID=433645 RepID=A0ABP7GU61_9MICO
MIIALVRSFGTTASLIVEGDQLPEEESVRDVDTALDYMFANSPHRVWRTPRRSARRNARMHAPSVRSIRSCTILTDRSINGVTCGATPGSGAI